MDALELGKSPAGTEKIAKKRGYARLPKAHSYIATYLERDVRNLLNIGHAYVA